MFERLRQALRSKSESADANALLHPRQRTAAQAGTGIPDGLRDALFGDTPLPALLKRVAADALLEPPFSAFNEAQRLIRDGRERDAIPVLQSLLPGSESRVQLLAWNALRKLGVQPSPGDAKQALGVVVEIPVETGLDLVAAYPEHTARYYNYSGAGVIWETVDTRLNAQIDDLLATGQRVADAIGPWEGDRPGPPTQGRARINILTRSGLHFGEGSADTFMHDSMAGPIIHAAFLLMQGLMAAQHASHPDVADEPTAS